MEGEAHWSAAIRERGVSVGKAVRQCSCKQEETYHVKAERHDTSEFLDGRRGQRRGKERCGTPGAFLFGVKGEQVALYDDGYDAEEASLASSTTRYFVTVTAGCEKKVLAAVLWLF